MKGLKVNTFELSQFNLRHALCFSYASESINNDKIIYLVMIIFCIWCELLLIYYLNIYNAPIGLSVKAFDFNTF